MVDRWSRGPTLEGGGERGLSVAERIAARAAEAPSAPAVVDGDGAVLSYGELLARADALAGRLRALGVGPGRTVGLGLGRSAQAVVAIVAAWRAGAAYVPLDLAHPSVRLAQVLADARPAVLLVDAASEAALPAPPSGCVVERLASLHAPAAPLVGGANDAARPRMGDPGPRHLHVGLDRAPKGVVVTQGALGHLLDALDRTIYRPHGVKRGLTSRPLRVGLSASLAFDASVKQLGAAGAGARAGGGAGGGAAGPGGAGRVRAGAAAGRARHDPKRGCTGCWRPGCSTPTAHPACSLSAVRPCRRRCGRRWRRPRPRRPGTCTGRRSARSTPRPRGSADDRGPNLGRPLPNVTALVLDRRIGARPDRRRGRTVPGRGRAGAGLPPPPGPDRRAVRARTRSRRGPGSGCTGPATGPAGRPTGRWSTWDVPIVR